jgi:alkylation response protein AidB-like acyl-CoA dehydrogenase
MRLDLDDEQLLIQQAARDVLTARASIRRAREVADRPDGFDATLWGELCELGWPATAIPEGHAGQGLGLIDLAILLEEHGRGCAPTPLLGTVLAGLALSAAGTDFQQGRWLPELAGGASAACGFCAGRGAPTVAADISGALVAVLVDLDGGAAHLVVDPACRSAATIDRTRAYGIVLPGLAEPLGGDVTAALDRMLVAVAAELVGLSQRALDLTAEYLKDRRQFGQPIGAFQSVAHLAAEMFRDVEGARWATRAAAAAIDLGHDDATAVAAVAASAAADAAVDVTSTAIQLHGAVGFTWEADVHLLYKRALVTARLVGGAETHRTRALRAALGH